MEYLSLGAIVLFSYLLGSIPTGYWVGKASKGIDVREVGSGSTGATNVLRSVGKKEALIVLIVDILKGFAPVALANYLETSNIVPILIIIPNLPAVIAAIFAIFGHSRSIFLNFTGGKSAATGLGTLFALHPLAAFATLAVWLTVLFSSKIVSLASIAAACACPIFMFVFKAPQAILGYGVIAFLYVTIRHKSNIKRLLNGSEPKFTDKPKASATEEAVSTDKPKASATEEAVSTDNDKVETKLEENHSENQENNQKKNKVQNG